MIKMSQYFTGFGIWGVVLFVVGNIFSAGLLASVMSAPAYAPLDLSKALMMIVFGFAALISIPMMLVGRDFDVEIKHIPKDLLKRD